MSNFTPTSTTPFPTCCSALSLIWGFCTLVSVFIFYEYFFKEKYQCEMWNVNEKSRYSLFSQLQLTIEKLLIWEPDQPVQLDVLLPVEGRGGHLLCHDSLLVEREWLKLDWRYIGWFWIMLLHPGKIMIKCDVSQNVRFGFEVFSICWCYLAWL